MRSPRRWPVLLALAVALAPAACLRPPPRPSATVATANPAIPPQLEKFTELDAWSAAARMSPAINIGNTLENTTVWETGWGNPLITREYVQALARLGFKTVRLPVAWDTYALDQRIDADKLGRVNEVVDWITGAGMFCVINIHWDGGWIDSDVKERFPDTFATFSVEAEKKFRSYWTQIATFFAGKGEKLIFEGLNEETNFSNAGSVAQAYATLTRVNQLFIDTVRKTGGNNGKRLLIVTGYGTDFAKTCAKEYQMPKDAVPGKLFLSVHYYTPWTFCGLTEDADWGKVKPVWGDAADVKELDKLFDMMRDFATRSDVPIFIGEYGVTDKREPAARAQWLTAVTNAALARKMIPVLWDTGNDVSRHAPYEPSDALKAMLKNLAPPPAPTAKTGQ
jgi:endoglucanase